MATVRITSLRAESRLERRAWKVRDRACALYRYAMGRNVTPEAAQLAELRAARLMDASSRMLRCCGFDEFA